MRHETGNYVLIAILGLCVGIILGMLLMDTGLHGSLERACLLDGGVVLNGTAFTCERVK